MEYDDGEEPSFSDPEDFVDDISDQGKRGLRYNSPPANALRVAHSTLKITMPARN